MIFAPASIWLAVVSEEPRLRLSLHPRISACTTPDSGSPETTSTDHEACDSNLPSLSQAIRFLDDNRAPAMTPALFERLDATARAIFSEDDQLEDWPASLVDSIKEILGSDHDASI